MAYQIGEECIACDACRPACPVGAARAGEPVYVIDPDRCNDCRDVAEIPFCLAVCPVDCIGPLPGTNGSLTLNPASKKDLTPPGK